MKVTSPAGEAITVSRRWYLWPDVFTEDKFEAIGLSPTLARTLGYRKLGDRLLLALVALVFAVVITLGLKPVLITLTVFVVVLALLKYLGRPWRIEVIYRGRIVESEASDGFSETGRRIERVAALYQSGGLRLPYHLREGDLPQDKIDWYEEAAGMAEPERGTSLTPVHIPTTQGRTPKPEPEPLPEPEPEPEPMALPPLGVSYEGSEGDLLDYLQSAKVEEEEVCSPLPEPDAKADTEDEPEGEAIVEDKPLLPPRERLNIYESPLRRAIREMEEEEKLIAKAKRHSR